MAVAVFTCLAVTAEAQVSRTSHTTADSAPRAAATAVIAPGPRYQAGWLHRAMLGANYRDLWATRITVEVLDLHTFAGGLRPTERGGGLQTRSLRFRGADGREYAFRSLDKDPSRALPPELRETLVQQLLQDQVSSFHPAGALVVAPLLDATGIRHVQPRIVVLPDVPLLGGFREEFAGQLGTLEERPGPGFDESPEMAGALEVISSERLFEKMEQSHATRIDTRRFLAARLFDLFVGDRDRHRDQWRWARFGAGEDAIWEPIPRDRDMAFVKHEGLLLAITRNWHPHLVSFDRTYPSMLGLTWNSREIDRRLLVGLERPVWDSVARVLRAQLTDSVIDAGIRAMPKPLIVKNGGELWRALRSRRDRLRAAASGFYALLAREVDLRGTDQPDLAEVMRLDDGSVEVSLSPRTTDAAAPAPAYLRRRFRPRETKEVRVYLYGGEDRAVVRGNGRRGVTVRIIGGKGDDELVDSTAAGGEPTRFYDSSGRNRVIRGPRTILDRRPYSPPPTKRPQDPPRDWGHQWLPVSWTSYGPDVGLFLGGGRTLYRYGFRHHPYASRMTLKAGYALEAEKFRAQFTGEFHRSNSRSYTSLVLRASGIEVIRFHGLGNETPSDQPSAFYRVFQDQYLVEPAYVTPIARNVTVSLGTMAQYATTDERSNTLVGMTRPYGSGRFGQVGARIGLALDTRDRQVAATRGVHLTVGGTLYPTIWDVESTFGEGHGTAATYLSAGMPFEPTLALRVSGRHVWGTFPFYEASFVGGDSTLRGWGEERFAGRSSVYGNAELRLFLAKFFLFIPGDLGVFGLADVGRIYASGERSSEWHTGFGGGVWVAPLKRTNTISLAVARGDERTAVYLRSGFLF